MKVSRKLLVVGATSTIGAFFVPRYPAGAAEFTYKLSTDLPLTLPLTARALEAAAKVLRDSNGRLEIKVYPNSVLGTDADAIEQARIGAIEFVLSGDSVLANVVPVVGITKLPFLFPSYEAAWRAIDGPLGDYIRTAISKAGFYPLRKTWDTYLKQVFNRIRPIVSPDDMKGLKIRINPSPISSAFYNALGVSAVPIDFREVYTALQTHLVDGIDTGFSTVIASKLDEVLKFGSATNHQWGSNTMLANADAWQRLPKDLRDIVERNFDAEAVAERDDDRREDGTDAGQLKARGIALTQPNLPAFREAVRKAGLYVQWRSNYGDTAWGYLEKAVGPLR